MLDSQPLVICMCVEQPALAARLRRALSDAGFTNFSQPNENTNLGDAISVADLVFFEPSAGTSYYLHEFGPRKAWIAFVTAGQETMHQDDYLVHGVREVLYADELAPRQIRRSIARSLHVQQSQQQLSLYDGLTGLYSNRGFLEATDQAMFNVASTGRIISLLAMDIQRFNDINANYGFSFADRILTAVADRMRTALGPLAKIARLGGDEFLILLENLANKQASERLVKRILNLFDAPFLVQGEALHLQVDIGQVSYPQTLGSAEELMRKAHTAMHSAKQQNVPVYHHVQGEDLSPDRDLSQALRLALRRGEFEMFYQPKVCLQNQRLQGMEALIRWHHPERGLLLPGEFIQAAETSGLIVPLGYWIIEQVCRDLALIQSYGMTDVTVAANLSFRQLQDEQFCHVMPRLLSRSGVDTHRLEFELTETAVLTDPKRAMVALQEVHRLGVAISLDDFGTGYSSLTHIRQFPISTIKIDRSFTQRVTFDREAESIVRSIINLAHDLNLIVIAEGVENQAQLEFLVANGCDQVQGFLFSHPRPLWEVMQLVDLTLRPFEDAAEYAGMQRKLTL